MKSAAFEYLRPRDVAEAVAALALHGGSAKLLGGGQSLGPMLNLRLVRPTLLVDVSRVEALRRIEETPETWRIGGAVTHAQIEDSVGKLGGGEMLVEVAAGIAYRSVRNRGTIGGSLAHADPAADWPLALAALDATVVARGPGGQRTIAAEGLMLTTFTTGLRPDEIIEWVEAPKLSRSARHGYFKFCRKTGEFPDASAALVLDPERRVARLFVGSLDGAPRPLSSLAQAIAERGAAAATLDAIVPALADAAPRLDPIDRKIHAASVMRAVRRAFR